MPNAWLFSELAVPSLSTSYLAAADSTAEQSPRADIRTSYSRLSARLSLVRSVFTAMSISKAVHPTAEPVSVPVPVPVPVPALADSGLSSSRQYSRARRDDKVKESNQSRRLI